MKNLREVQEMGFQHIHRRNVGGNHDVKERFEDFLAKIYGTGEIKMVPDDAAKH